MDFCAGHPNNQEYHYHFHAHGSYEGCPNSCSQDAVSDIIGVALDGFAIYGPMQYYSASEGKARWKMIVSVLLRRH